MKLQSSALFELGEVVITKGANSSLMAEEVQAALERHHSGDWGDYKDRDPVQNNQALDVGDRLFSSYRSQTGIRFWIITEGDRSATTILLPSEY